MERGALLGLLALGVLAYLASSQAQAQAGGAALTDSNGALVTDSSGNPVTVDYAAPDVSTATQSTGDYSMPDNAIQMANLAAFLLVLRYCEGTATSSDEGYRALFGWRPGNGLTFSDYSTHPNIAKYWTNPATGAVVKTTAAGAYQINYPTFKSLGGTDFHPATQDALATQLIAQSGALQAVYAGDLQTAIGMLGGRWASLPSSTAGQPTRSYTFCENTFTANGGTLGTLA